MTPTDTQRAREAMTIDERVARICRWVYGAVGKRGMPGVVIKDEPAISFEEWVRQHFTEATSSLEAERDRLKDAFLEITAKATPLQYAPDDPNRVIAYSIPCGPLHRAAGKLGYQMFDGERHLAQAIADKRAAEQRSQELEAERDRLLLENEVLAEADQKMLRQFQSRAEGAERLAEILERRNKELEARLEEALDELLSLTLIATTASTLSPVQEAAFACLGRHAALTPSQERTENG